MSVHIAIKQNKKELNVDELFFQNVHDDHWVAMLSRTAVLEVAYPDMAQEKPVNAYVHRNFFEAEESVQEDIKELPTMSDRQMVAAGISALLYRKMLENGSTGLMFGFVKDREDPQVTRFKQALEEVVEHVSTKQPKAMADFTAHIFKKPQAAA